MDPEKGKRIRQRHEEWLRTHPLNLRLRARIDELKRRIAERDAQDERREAS
jgi:hypothetical protein